MSQGFTGQPPSLPSAEIIVGNSAGVGVATAMTGDVTISDLGVTTIKNNVALGGNPTTTTQSSSDNSTKVATTAFVKAATIATVTTPTDKTIPTFNGTGGATLQDTGVIIDANNALYNNIAKIQTVSTTTYTLLSTDTGTTILFTNASGCTVTLPNNLAIGTNVNLIQGGNGQVLLSPASGATIQTALSSGVGTSGVASEIWVVIITNSGTNAVYVLGGTTAVQTPAAPSPGGGPILQSVQPFTCTIAAGATSNTVTISAVVLANSYVQYNGITGQVATYAAETCQCYPTMTNTTTITVTRGTSDASNSLTYYGTVMEYKAGVVKSNNQGTIAITTTSNTATISAITVANAYIHWNGSTYGGASNDTNPETCFSRLAITNTTTLTATRIASTGSQTLTVSYACIEFNAGILNSATQTTIASTTVATSVAFTQTVPLQTMLVYAGMIPNSTAYVPSDCGCVQDIGGINITNLNIQVGGSLYTPVNYVVEFLAGTLTQKFQGNAAVAAAATTFVDTIPTSSTSKSLLCMNGCFPASPLTTFNEVAGGIAQTSSTQVTLTRNTLNNTIALRIPYTVYTFA